MKRSYVARVLDIELKREKITQAEFADRCQITQPSTWRILRGHIRLAVDTLQRITHCWEDEEVNLRMLVAHLRDEITRAGYDPEQTLDIRLSDGSPAISQRDQDIEDIRERLGNPDVAELVHNFAELLRRADKAKNIPPAARVWPGHAADPPASYDT